MPRIVAIIQARWASTRLPGKVLKTLQGRTVLGHVVQRVHLARRLDGVIVATTDTPPDDAVAIECSNLGVECFRGSEADVLGRYHGAARREAADVIVRITADCPLYDGVLLDRMLEEFQRLRLDSAATGIPPPDYMSNVLRRAFPRGLDTEIFTRAALDRAFLHAREAHEREHVTPFLYQHPEWFRLHSYRGDEDLSGHRWTLDTPEDWRFIDAVYGALHREGEIFGTDAVLKLLKERPELTKLNAHVEQKPLGR